MRFSRVSIIGTLAAAALALLVILPATAREGFDETGPVGQELSIGISKEGIDPISNLSRTSSGLEDTRLGAYTYVSNQRQLPNATQVLADSALTLGSELDPANTVHVNVPIPGDANAERYVRVRSDSGDPIWVDMSSPPATFKVIPPSGTAVNNDGAGVREIEALDGDTITITAGSGVLRLVVDGEGPSFSGITPANGRRQSSDSTTVSFTVTDSGSGLRTDSEDGDADMNGGDVDNDGQFAEPLSIAGGASADLDVFWNRTVNNDGEVLGGDEESRGSRSWIEEEENKSYSLTYGRADLDSQTHKWYIEATDRVGNKARTDASSKASYQDFSLIVDNEPPTVKTLAAGIGFDEDDGEEINDSSSIRVIFEDGDLPNVDPLDSSTIEVDDFEVEGNTVVAIIHPDEEDDVDKNKLLQGQDYTLQEAGEFGHMGAAGDGTTGVIDAGEPGNLTGTNDDGTGVLTVSGTDDTPAGVVVKLNTEGAESDDTCDSHTGSDGEPGNPCIDTRNRLYLVLASPLGDNDEPEITIGSGGVRDLAGNNSVYHVGDATDRIAPTLTIGVAGDVETSGRPLAQEEVTISIEAGERLLEDPQVWLAAFDHEGKIVGVPTPGNPTSTGTNAWEVEFDGDEETKVLAIVIRAEDGDQNITTSAGWKGTEPTADDELDLAKLDAAGLLVEFDFGVDDAMVTLNPSTEDEPLKTESVNPFIELRYTEGKENTVTYTEGEGEDEETKTANSYTNRKDVETKFDSYGKVELSAVTLDGVDVTDSVARVSSAGFDLALGGLAVGDHTLEFTATDTAGNSNTEEVDFEVLPRSAYEVDLRPGWNLVSLPGDPVDTAIDSVLPADHPAIEILKYDAGLWIASVREAGQPWEGELTDIDGRSAYWVNTTSTKPLEAVLVQPGVGSASRPPAIPLITGWNLIPVTDLDQEEAGTAQAKYFSSLSDDDFVVAYSYDARNRKWARLTMEDDVENGQGIWVYSRSNVTLVP